MPRIKTIAVPASQGARRNGRIAPVGAMDHAIGDEGSTGSPARAPVKALSVQPSHRYRIGERLRMANGGYAVARSGSYCQVTGLLPYEGRGALLYRVRSEAEQFERVVSEVDLTRNSDGAS